MSYTKERYKKAPQLLLFDYQSIIGANHPLYGANSPGGEMYWWRIVQGAN